MNWVTGTRPYPLMSEERLAVCTPLGILVGEEDVVIMPEAVLVGESDVVIQPEADPWTRREYASR